LTCRMIMLKSSLGGSLWAPWMGLFFRFIDSVDLGLYGWLLVPAVVLGPDVRAVLGHGWPVASPACISSVLFFTWSISNLFVLWSFQAMLAGVWCTFILQWILRSFVSKKKQKKLNVRPLWLHMAHVGGHPIMLKFVWMYTTRDVDRVLCSTVNCVVFMNHNRDFILKMEYYAMWLLLRMQGGAVARGHKSCWKQLAKWYQFLEFFLLNCWKKFGRESYL
jgi:hypothetical protein